MLLVRPIGRIILQNRVAELIHSVVLYESVEVKHSAYVRNSGRRRIEAQLQCHWKLARLLT
jgi:hypothetical protein